MKERYFGSVRFFKHVIYGFMVSVAAIGIFFLYSLGTKLFSANRGSARYIASAAAASFIDDDAMAPDVKAMGSIAMPAIGGGETAAVSPADTLAPSYTPTPGTETVPPETEETEEEEEAAQPDESVYSPETIGYQLLYPDLYVTPSEDYAEEEGKVAYLTFDDGPSARTLDVLDTLKKYDIKATFFVVTKNLDTDILKRIAEEGQTIGIHTHSHKYTQIYDSIEAYLEDFNTAFEAVYEATGVKPSIFRFPGGSINAYNRGFYEELNAEMLRRGFMFYDWNVSAGDSAPNTGSDRIYSNIINGIGGQEKLIILLHDSQQKYASAKALPRVIEYLQSNGYSFAPLDNRVEPIVFSYK